MNSVVVIPLILVWFFTSSCGIETQCESVEYTLLRVPQINATGMCALATPTGAYLFGGKTEETTLEKPLEFIEGTSLSSFTVHSL
jgi:hypothetical protein